MPFIPHTPEAAHLLAQTHAHNTLKTSPNSNRSGSSDSSSDNKSSTVCRGVTAKGEACRRTVAAARTFGGAGAGGTCGTCGAGGAGGTGIAGGGGVGDVVFYCWQHKEQADRITLAVGAGGAGGGGSAVRRARLNWDGDGNGNGKSKSKSMGRIGGRHAIDVSNKGVQRKSSIDTLVMRLGMMDVGSEVGREEQRARSDHRQRHGINNRYSMPVTTAHVDNEKDRRAHGVSEKQKYTQDPKYARLPHGHHRESNAKKEKKKGYSPPRRSFLSVLCFGNGAYDDNYLEVVRHKSRLSASPGTAVQGESEKLLTRDDDGGRHNRHSDPREYSKSQLQRQQHRQHHDQAQNRQHGLDNITTSKIGDAGDVNATPNLLSYIPQTLSPQTTAQLLAELSKPISPSDEEGYIYIFWLSDTTNNITTPPTLSPTTDSPSQRKTRRASSSMNITSNDNTTANANTTTAATATASTTKPILLKIGRASNVHRRMNEWSRQCGYELSLLRWYPYNPSLSSLSSAPPLSPPSPLSPSPPGSATATSRARLDPQTPLSTQPPTRTTATSPKIAKVPHVHRVERLIHIELAGQRVRQGCSACGKEHREWFEVEGSRAAVGRVDAVVRRWVEWSFEVRGS